MIEGMLQKDVSKRKTAEELYSIVLSDLEIDREPPANSFYNTRQSSQIAPLPSIDVSYTVLEEHARQHTFLAFSAVTKNRLSRLAFFNQLLDQGLQFFEMNFKPGTINLFAYRVVQTHIVKDLYYLLINFYQI
jgi:hypothetical protein